MVKEQMFLQRGKDDHEDIDYFGNEGEREMEERKKERELFSVLCSPTCFLLPPSSQQLLSTTS